MKTVHKMKPGAKLTFLGIAYVLVGGRLVASDKRKRFTGTYVRDDDGAPGGIIVRMDLNQTGTLHNGQELLVFPQLNNVWWL